MNNHFNYFSHELTTDIICIFHHLQHVTLISEKDKSFDTSSILSLVFNTIMCLNLIREFIVTCIVCGNGELRKLIYLMRKTIWSR